MLACNYKLFHLFLQMRDKNLYRLHSKVRSKFLALFLLLMAILGSTCTHTPVWARGHTSVPVNRLDQRWLARPDLVPSWECSVISSFLPTDCAPEMGRNESRYVFFLCEVQLAGTQRHFWHAAFKWRPKWSGKEHHRITGVERNLWGSSSPAPC